MKRTLQSASVIFGIFAFLVYLGFGIGSTIVAPGHAFVFADAEQGMYIAPPCLSRENWSLYQQVTIGQARKLKLIPEPKCRDEGGFTQEGRSLSGNILEQLGLLSRLQSRWNPDGTWNW